MGSGEREGVDPDLGLDQGVTGEGEARSCETMVMNSGVNHY